MLGLPCSTLKFKEAASIEPALHLISPEEPTKREQPMSEQRNHLRQRVLKAGTIAFDGSGIDCVVRNISATGAALEVESQLGIPPLFQLVISAERFSQRCRVLWRKEKRIGVVFEAEPSAGGAAPLAPSPSG
jgi:hypothetical protein